MFFSFNRPNELSQEIQQAKDTFETHKKNLIDEIATLKEKHPDLIPFFLSLLTFIEDPSKEMIVNKDGQQSIFYANDVYYTLPTSEAKAKFNAFKQALKRKNELEKIHQYENELKKLDIALSQKQNDMEDLQASIQLLIPYIKHEAQKSYKTRYEMIWLIQSVRKLLDPNDENGIKPGDIEIEVFYPEYNYRMLGSRDFYYGYSNNCYNTEKSINKVPGHTNNSILCVGIGIFSLGAASLFASTVVGLSFLSSSVVATAGIAALTLLVIGIGLMALGSMFALNGYYQTRTGFSEQLDRVVVNRKCYESKCKKLEKRAAESEAYQSKRDSVLQSKATTNDPSLVQVVEAIEAAYGNTDLSKAYAALLLYINEICRAKTPDELELHRASFLRKHADKIELTRLVSAIVDSMQTSMREKEKTEKEQLNDKFESKLGSLRP